MTLCLLALGANQGDAATTLANALDALAKTPGLVWRAGSSIHRTQPIGGPSDQPQYANAAALIETDLSPQALLRALQAIENRFGRERRVRWGPRTLDVDLILYGETILDSPDLTLPHPRFAWRRFVLAPAVEIAGDLRDPRTGRTLRALLTTMNEAPKLIAVAGACWLAKNYVAASAAAALGVPPLVARGVATVGAPAVSDPEHALVEHYIELVPRLADAWNAACAAGGWQIAGFWPPEVRLAAETMFAGAAQASGLQAFEQAFAAWSPPRLLVYLHTPDELLLFNPAAASAPQRAHGQRLATERDRLAVLARARHPMPMLEISAAAPELAVREIVAAARASE